MGLTEIIVLFLSITSTSCQSCLQTTTWITVRRRWMRWMPPCQTWRLLWREGRRPTPWYDSTTPAKCSLQELQASFFFFFKSIIMWIYFLSCSSLAVRLALCFFAVWWCLLSSVIIKLQRKLTDIPYTDPEEGKSQWISLEVQFHTVIYEALT